MKYLYLLVDIFSVIIPFVFSFHKRLLFYKNWAAAFPAILLTALFFIVWDIYYTYLGVWGFNPRYLSGVYLFNLPIEEVLFFICIPYACLFSYHCFNVLLKKDYFLNAIRFISFGMLAVSASLALFNYDKLYTLGTCLLLFLFLSALLFHIKPLWLGRFFFAYLFLLIPFFIVNGILTGTGLEEPVVWYNNSENINIRVMTIPVEDFLYGMLMILMNVSLFERFSEKRL